MPPSSDRPLRRVTINLYEEDAAFMEERAGRGWSESLRNLLHNYVKEKRKMQTMSSTDWERLRHGQ